jgi:hypothetical protein
MNWKGCGRNKWILIFWFLFKIYPGSKGTLRNYTVSGPRFEHEKFQARSVIAIVPTTSPLKKEDITDCGTSVCVMYARMIDVLN